MGYNLKYVYSKKKDDIERLANKFAEVDSSIVESYEKATILPRVEKNGERLGGVIDSAGNYVELSGYKQRAEGKYEFDKEKCTFINKKVVYCGYFLKAWGHFITEVVSRLWYALQNDESVDAYVFIDNNDGNLKFSGNYLEFLKLLNIDDKVIIINKPTKFSSVIVPENGFVYHSHFTKKFVDMYKYINKRGLEKYNGPKYEKIYFSKNKIVSTITSNINAKFVDKYFERNGYKIFYPEELTLIETIGLMQNAKYFAALSSSLAHNQLFGHSNQTMISIEKQAFYTPYQIFVGNITKCDVIFIDAFRHIFPVGSYGPFLYDYTNYFDMFTKDFGLIPAKPMSKIKYRRLFKKYMVFYFNLNNEMPPDWMYGKNVIEMSREAYNDTIKNGDIFHMSVFQRVLLKVRKNLFKWLGPY